MNNEESKLTNSKHIPVLTKPLLSNLGLKADQVIVDCTIGLGGHARAILEKEPSIRIIGLDMDATALRKAGENLAEWKDQVTLVSTNFSQLRDVLKKLELDKVDAIYADIGVSSMQLDLPHRGFSHQHDGPLDMRMNPDGRMRAADIINSLKESELSDLLYRFGDENKSKKIAKEICHSRRSHRIDSTKELAELVCKAVGVDPSSVIRKRIHPATKTFQALRIAVNDELESLKSLLDSAYRLLNVGGRFAVISFHSLEDRLVKDDFRMRAKDGLYQILTAKPIEAEPTEILQNPRSRSAKLRVAQKTS